MNAALDVALFHGAPAAELLPLTMIEPWPDNPRRSIDPAHLIELADSISKVGVLQPILVRPIGAMFSIVSGERRYRAAKRAGLEVIPAVVRTLTDAEALEIAVTENLQREDVPPLDEAEGYERLHTVHAYSIEEIADKVGKSKTYVYARLKLTSLCAEAREYLRGGRLTPTVALLVARIPTPSEQLAAATYCAADYSGRPLLSATQAANYIRRKFMLRLGDARFPTDDANLVPAAGACGACPKRTGCTPQIFGDIADADTCTDATCYAGKARAHMERLAAAHEAEGGKVIRGAEARNLHTHGKYLFGEYVGLDTPCNPDVNGRRTWAELAALAKKPPAIVLVEGRDEWVRGIDRKAAEKMLVKLGIVEEESDDEDEPASRSAPQNTQHANDWQMQLEQRRALYTAIVGGSQDPAESLTAWRAVAASLIAVTDDFQAAAGALWRLNYRIDPAPDFTSAGIADECRAYIARLAEQTNNLDCLMHLCVAIALEGLIFSGNNEHTDLIAIASELNIEAAPILERTRIDVEAERAEALAKIAAIEAAPKDPKPKKPRKKKVAEAEPLPQPVDVEPALLSVKAGDWPFPKKTETSDAQ